MNNEANIALTGSEIKKRLKQVNSKLNEPWMTQGNKLQKSFTFADFTEAFAFMTRCALLAERANHHPDWHNVYNRVTINLSTHDVDGVSVRDFELLKAIEQIDK
jgi:4a-hydroxytetrahydrobiopterin dehydratase